MSGAGLMTLAPTATAIGADLDRYEADALVKRLKDDAATFRLGYTVKKQTGLEVPAYHGSTTVELARPAV